MEQWFEEQHCPNDRRSHNFMTYNPVSCFNVFEDGRGCENDAAEAMEICGARKGTKVSLYDTGELKKVGTDENDDDVLEVFVKQTMPADYCEFFETFEKDGETTYLLINNTPDSRWGKPQNLNGKVSGMIRDVPGL